MDRSEKALGTRIELARDIASQQICEFQPDDFNDPRWGTIKPIYFRYLDCQLYGSPQFPMVTFTALLTLLLEGVMLNFVFFGVHFYIGLFLCLYILYLLFSLAFSNPGIAFAQYQKLQAHLDLQICNSSCSHAASLQQQFSHFCNKCNSPTTPTTRHCNQCHCCVVDYDHHCVFIGKCVGSKNLGKFKLFLGLIFSTLIYGFISGLYSATQIRKLKQHSS